MNLQKVTNIGTAKRPGGAHGRWYDDACGAAFAMELVGERWSLLIVRELMFGGRRFTDLRAALPAISARVLAERLEGMETAGIVQRRELPPPLAVKLYELTPLGLAADESLLALCRWSLLSPARNLALGLSPVALMMSLRAMFVPVRGQGLAVRATIRVGEDCFALAVADGMLAVRRGEDPDAQLALASDTIVLRRLFYGKVTVAQAEAMGLAVAGDRAALARLADCFELPEKRA